LFYYEHTWGGGTAVILAGVGVVVAVGTVAIERMATGVILAVVVVVIVAAGPIAGRHIAIGVVVGDVVAVGPVAIMHIATGVVGVVGVHGGSVMHCIITLRVRV